MQYFRLLQFVQAGGFVRFAVLSLTVVLAMASFSMAQAADVVRVGALRFTSSAPIFIAYERGYFRDEGIDIEFKFFQGAQPVAVAIASGDVDVGLTALSAGFFNLAGKGALKVIGGHMHEEAGYDGSAVLASNQAYADGFTSVGKIRGRSLGITQVGSSFHYMAGQIAEREGFPLSEIKLRPLQKVGAVIAALKSGQVDAMIIVPHIARDLDRAGAAKIVGWVYDYAPYQVTTLFTSTDNVANRAELLKRFVKAYQRGIADYRAVLLTKDKDRAKVDEMLKLIHKYVYADKPFEKVAGSIEAGAIYVNEAARLDVGDVYKQLAWFQKEGLVDAGVQARAIVDLGFVEGYNLP